MERYGLGLGALALAALLGCGTAGETAIDDSKYGTGGSDADTSGGNDGSGGTSGIVSGGGGFGGDDESPRECLEGELLSEDVVAATERCIDPETVVRDLELLDGSSFVLQGSLCLEAWDSEGFDKSSLSTLHFRRVGDDLELVSALPTSAAPIVQRSTLERTSVGSAATELIVCNETAYDWEDACEVLTYEAPAVHLVFVPGTIPGELELVLAARLESEGATVVLGGKPDLVPPSLRSLDVPGEHLRAYERGYDPEQAGGVEPPYYFFFDEPVLAGALSVDDGVGGHVPLEPIERHGFVVGLRVEDLVLGEPAFDLTVSDLAGNAWKPGMTYPGVTLAPVDGDVEWDEDYVAAEPYWACNQAELLTLEELAGPPPLEGERSLFLDDCAAYFRVQRFEAATTLTFDMRAYAPTTELEVQVRAIGANGAKTSSTITPEPPSEGSDPPAAAVWPVDPVYGSEAKFVSQPRKISVPLPPEGDEFVVRIASNEGLLIDGIAAE